MKSKKSIVAAQIVLIFFTPLSYTSYSSSNDTHTFFRMRPQGADAARQLVGWQELLYNDNCTQQGAFALTAAYNQSFWSKQLAEYFFNTNSFFITGSRVNGRQPKDLLADYFGLPTDFNSRITCNPKIQSFLFDYDLFYKLDSLFCGAYFRAHAPLIFSKWDLGFDETVKTAGTFNHIGGYMSSELLLRKNLLPNAHAFFSGTNNSIFGDMRSPLKYGRIGCTKKTSWQLGDIEIELGHNKYYDNKHHVGIGIRCVIPVSPMPLGEYLFAPMIGNGHHYELGLDFSGHTTFYESPCHTYTWALYAQANLMHLLKGPEIRSFDLKNNGLLSRYILLEEIVSPQIGELFIGTTFDSGGAVLSEGVRAQVQYNRTLVPAINLLTFTSNVSIPLQADVVIKFAYQGPCWGIDFGYNLWARTKESVRRTSCLQANRWAVKGDAQVYGDDAQSVGSLALLPLNATQHCATIYAGQGSGNANQKFLNLNADSADLVGRSDPCIIGNKLLVVQADGANLDLGVGGQLIGESAQVSSSLYPIFINDQDINNNSAQAPKAISNALFIHCNYNKEKWYKQDNTPQILFCGIGAKIEFGHAGPHHGSLSQWGIWLKGGSSF